MRPVIGKTGKTHVSIATREAIAAGEVTITAPRRTIQSTSRPATRQTAHTAPHIMPVVRIPGCRIESTTNIIHPASSPAAPIKNMAKKEKRTGQTANSPAGMRKAPAGTLLRTGRKRSPVFSFPHAKRHISKTHETTQEAARSPGTPSRPQAEEKNKRKKIGMPFEAQTSARNATSSRIAAGSIPGKPSPVSENLFKPERQPNPSRPRTENPSHGWADIRSETGL